MSKEKEQQVGNWLEEVLPKIKAGSTIKVHQKIKEKNTKGEEKERIQIFEGIVLSRKGGSGKSATITVRKVASNGIGVERIFPIYSTNIAKVDFVKQAVIKRAKAYHLRTSKKKLKEAK